MSVKILIAEDNDVSREMMAGILRGSGYAIIGAIDGQEAIDSVKNNLDIAMAFVDINMSPKGGFEFVKYLKTNNIPIPVVIVTGDNSSDILTEASALGVSRVIQKPIEPNRLIQTAQRVLERHRIKPTPLATETRRVNFPPEEIMRKVLDMAANNARSGHGRPFGAIVTDSEGHILGEGVNGINSRIDPTAHAEVMAIRNAAEKLGKPDLSDCVLYCSSEPTMMGQALIISAGIRQVYFGLTHDEIRQIRADEETVRAEMSNRQETQYIQLCHDEALEMFRKSQK